jgi:hypothetical protein
MAVSYRDLVFAATKFTPEPVVGRVVVTPSTRVLNSENDVLMIPVAMISLLDGDGVMDPLPLVCSDSDDVVPTGFTYHISIEIEGAGVRAFNIFVPKTTAPLYPAVDLFPSLVLFPSAG